MLSQRKHATADIYNQNLLSETIWISKTNQEFQKGWKIHHLHERSCKPIKKH